MLLYLLVENHGIAIFPLERHMYDNMKSRKHEDIEVDIATVTSKKSPPKQVAYFRVLDLPAQIQKHVQQKQDNDDVVLHENFEDKIWVKVGGDKGGKSSKLVFEIANDKQCNSADNTEIISVYQ